MSIAVVGTSLSAEELTSILNRCSDDMEPEFDLDWVRELMNFNSSNRIFEGGHSSFSDYLLAQAYQDRTFDSEELAGVIFFSLCLSLAYANGQDFALEASDFLHIHMMSAHWREQVEPNELLIFFVVVAGNMGILAEFVE